MPLISTLLPFLHGHALSILSLTLFFLSILLVQLTHRRRRFPPPNPSISAKNHAFYGTRRATAPPLTFTHTAPLPNAITLPPDQWHRDPYISPDRVYVPTMALRSCAPDDWLRIDCNYAARMAHKRRILDEVGWPGAIDCRPEADAAVEELLEDLVAYLPRRFPGVWGTEEEGSRVRWLRNGVTGERWEVVAPWGGLRAVEVVARVTEEDLAVLVPGEGEEEKEEEEYVLKAAVSAFPAGFEMREKMDKGLTAIHGPVPVYKERLRTAMNKFFKSVGPEKLVMRVNWGINDREELFFLEGTHLHEGDTATANEHIDINQVQLRVERQVLRRLPKSGAMCMLTKTYLYRLVDIAEEPGFAARLGGMLHKLPEKIAFYKGKPLWGKVVLAYLDEMAAKHPTLPGVDEEGRLLPACREPESREKNS